MNTSIGQANQPLVSVGIPIFNEAALLRVHIEELTRQTHKNLEMLIFDNASTDNSFGIARDLCAEDSRVSVYRQPKNLGGEANFVACLGVASGEFFMWAQPDDGHDRDFISRGVRELRLRHDAVSVTAPDLPYSKWAIGSRKWRTSGLTQDSVEDRVRAFFDIAWTSNAFFSGLHRRVALESVVSGFHAFPGDWVVLLGLARQGKLLRTIEGRMVIGDSGQSNSGRRFAIQRKHFVDWVLPFHRGQAQSLAWEWEKGALEAIRDGWRTKNRQARKIQIKDALRSRLHVLPGSKSEASARITRRSRYIDVGDDLCQ